MSKQYKNYKGSPFNLDVVPTGWYLGCKNLFDTMYEGNTIRDMYMLADSYSTGKWCAILVNSILSIYFENEDDAVRYKLRWL